MYTKTHAYIRTIQAPCIDAYLHAYNIHTYMYTYYTSSKHTYIHTYIHTFRRPRHPGAARCINFGQPIYTHTRIRTIQAYTHTYIHTHTQAAKAPRPRTAASTSGNERYAWSSNDQYFSVLNLNKAGRMPGYTGHVPHFRFQVCIFFLQSICVLVCTCIYMGSAWVHWARASF
jgi:hypothetical protein